MLAERLKDKLWVLLPDAAGEVEGLYSEFLHFLYYRGVFPVGEAERHMDAVARIECFHEIDGVGAGA